MAHNLGCWFIILKIVDFKVDGNILWNTQNEPDCTIFIIFSGGACSLTPLAQVLIKILTALTSHLVCNSLARLLDFFYQNID